MFTFVGMGIYFVPVVGEYTFWTVTTYQLVLTFIAVKVITKLNWWEAIMSFVIGTVGAIVSAFFVPLLILSLLQTNSQIFKP